MQVIQTINDTIRILFSPEEEDFKLLDFLLVQESDNKYLAQIIEIYDDKYDASQNVARVKLFFKVNENGEVFGYDHFTPSKECEISKLKKEEILTFINEGKEALNIGLDYRSEEPLDINLDFLKNNAVIFADRIDHSNNISASFARTLSRYNKHSVIFDFTGALEIKNAEKLKITKDIKLPLDFYSLDYIWEKGLSTASLETQAICREIFNEVKTFAKNTPDGFIPFDKFLNVVEIQYKATPIIELTVLLNKLKAYQKNNIFAKSKKDFEAVKKAVDKNDITIIDFSEVKTSWHKEFCDFVIRNMQDDVFVFLRLNETNTDVDLINFIYDKKPKTHFISSVSYSFSKMPHIIERAQNYVLLPTLNPKRDFGAASFELMSINKDECILFGEDTENFIFTIKNDRFESNVGNAPKALKKTRLKLSDSGIKTGNALKEKFRAAHKEEVEQQGEDNVLTEEELEFFAQFEEPVNEKAIEEEEKTPVKKPEESDAIGHYEEEISPQETSEALDEIETPQEEEEIIAEEHVEEIQEDSEASDNEVQEENEPENVVIEEEQPEQEIQLEEISEQEPVLEQDLIIETEEPEEEIQKTTEEEIIEQEPYVETEPKKDNTNTQEEVLIDTKDSSEEEIEDKEEELSDKNFQNIFKETQEETAEEETQEDTFSLEELAQQSVENAFNQVIDEEDEKEEHPQEQKDDSSALVIDDNVVIDLEKIKEHIDTKNGSELPIFKNKTEVKEKETFNTGDKIEHDKYGKGEVVKVINYANRSLLQINFEEIGKRLLDPDIANIKKADG